MIYVDVVLSGHLVVQIDEETGLDQWGNDYSKFLEELKLKKLGVYDVVDWFDTFISDIENCYDIRVYDDAGTDYVDDHA